MSLLKWLSTKKRVLDEEDESRDIKKSNYENSSDKRTERSFENITSSVKDINVTKESEVNSNIDEVGLNDIPVVSDSRESILGSEIAGPSQQKQDFPDCWSESQYNYFSSENSWLFVEDKKLGCNVCKEGSKLGLGAYKGAGNKLVKAWVECKVHPNGNNIKQQQSSLRKKIFEHKNSESHKKVASIRSESNKKHFETSLDSMNAKYIETTVRVFRTAYKIAKRNRPFVDLQADVELQELNGLDMGRVLHTNFSCANIIDHISQEMRNKIAQTIIENERKISIIIDESTTVSSKSVLVICLRCALSEDSEVVSFFWDLVELESTTADVIKNEILKNLNSYGINEDFLKKHLVGLACDGASVMLGRQNGVAAQFLKLFPDIIIWHCLNHRLELAVSDARNEVQGINHFHSFIDKLYSLYSMSPKNQRELNICAASLEERLKKIGKIFTIRWVASSQRTVKAVWENYSALNKHFSEAKLDNQRDSKERAKFQGLENMLSSVQFLENLGVMYDALNELTGLSLELQKRNTSLEEAQNAIKRTIKVFESMCSSVPGEYHKKALRAAEDKKIRDIQLHESKKVVKIDSKQFFRSLVNNLNSRLVENVFTASHLSTSSIQNKDDRMTRIISASKVLYKNNWPSTSTLDICYGDESIGSLCNFFHILEKRRYINAFRMYVENREIPIELMPLIKIVETIPISTAECERAFSTMNEIHTEKRNKLMIARSSGLIFISSVGPPVQMLNPVPYVKSWLRKGRRSADETACRKHEDAILDTQYESIWKLLN